jgi:acyl-CoA dehydrogenase
MQGLGSGTITLFGSEEQKQAYLPAVARGEKIAAFALTDPGSGSDVAAMETSARETSSGFEIEGAKTYISNGGIADYYVLFARTGEAAGARGISAFIIDADTPGLSVAERIRVIAPHPLATLRFERMALPSSALLGTRGQGFAHAMATLDVFRTTVGAAALGFARRALDEATARALTRKLGQGTLADNPITQSKLAEMVLDVDASALLIYRAAWLRDVKGQRNSREAALAKLHATDSAQSVIDKAVQMFGGLGVTHGVPVESLYREIRALRIYEGASEVQKVIIARAHLAGFAQ